MVPVACLGVFDGLFLSARFASPSTIVVTSRSGSPFWSSVASCEVESDLALAGAPVGPSRDVRSSSLPNFAASTKTVTAPGIVSCTRIGAVVRVSSAPMPVKLMPIDLERSFPDLAPQGMSRTRGTPRPRHRATSVRDDQYPVLSLLLLSPPADLVVVRRNRGSTQTQTHPLEEDFSSVPWPHPTSVT